MSMMVDAIEEVCGRERKEVANPWVIDREEEIEEKIEQIRRKRIGEIKTGRC